jgi:hypothetical protein
VFKIEKAEIAPLYLSLRENSCRRILEIKPDSDINLASRP